MKILICQAAAEDGLREAARAQPHPYRIFRGQEGYLLQVEAVSSAAAEELERRFPSSCRVWELLEEGCREAGDA
ncbi:hypothetical protein [Oceanithermus sp.]